MNSLHVKDFEILYVDISDHFPLLYIMRFNVESRIKMMKDHSVVKPWRRFNWGTNGERQFLQRLSYLLNGNFLGGFSTAVEEDTNVAAKIMVDCLHEACRFLIKKSIFKDKQPQWWDEDCSFQKFVKKKCVLNHFRRTCNVGTLNSYILEKRTF